MWFVRQYDDYKAEDRKWRNGEYDKMRVGNSVGKGHSDPTACEAVRLASSRWAWKIAVIEQAAVIVAPGFCKELLRNVTQDITWEHLSAPVCRPTFYEARRKFFAELHCMLEKT